MNLPESIGNAVDEMSRLPGVGKKSALRYILSMTEWNKEAIHQFTKIIDELSMVNKCAECGMYTDEHLCIVCLNERRKENKIICVVETVVDAMAIENSQQFEGVYHILGGVLNPLLGIGPDQLKLDFFKKRIERLGVAEIILAVNPSVEGDATCSYIASILNKSVSVKRIGFGVPIGGHLEYLDPLTITKALENSKAL